MVNLKYKNKEWLRTQRCEFGRTEADIAEECGVSQSIVHYWVKKYNFITPKKTKNILKEYTGVDIEKVKNEVEKAGGREKWVENQAYILFKMFQNSAKLYAERGNPEQASKESVRAAKVLEDFRPSRSKIDVAPPIKGPTSDDHKAIIKLNNMLEKIEEDFNAVRGEKTIVEGGWDNRPKLSVHPSPGEVERDIQEESLADDQISL